MKALKTRRRRSVPLPIAPSLQIDLEGGTRSRGETISLASVPLSLHSERPSERLFVLAVSGIRQQ
jgi:hypothetical protein